MKNAMQLKAIIKNITKKKRLSAQLVLYAGAISGAGVALAVSK